MEDESSKMFVLLSLRISGHCPFSIKETRGAQLTRPRLNSEKDRWIEKEVEEENRARDTYIERARDTYIESRERVVKRPKREQGRI